MVYMWQEQKGRPYYRFQTDDKDIADKMKRRNKFALIGWGVNCDLWIYQVSFSRPDIAKKVFKTLTGKVAILDKKKDVFTD
ncbi:MAG: hypothetical protein KAI72_02100 [Candidatus Pacebacteria bacterium]|nr:hypothetical protein [Candidatus Paceibacterota bacterium]